MYNKVLSEKEGRKKKRKKKTKRGCRIPVGLRCRNGIRQKNEKALVFSGYFTPFRRGEPYIYSRTLTAECGHVRCMSNVNYAVQKAPVTIPAAQDAQRVMFVPAAVFSEDCLYVHRSFPAVFPTAIPGGITSLSFAVTT